MDRLIDVNFKAGIKERQNQYKSIKQNIKNTENQYTIDALGYFYTL